MKKRILLAALLAATSCEVSMGQTAAARGRGNAVLGVDLIPMGNARISRGRIPLPRQLREDTPKEWAGWIYHDKALEKTKSRQRNILDGGTSRGKSGWLIGEVLDVLSDSEIHVMSRGEVYAVKGGNVTDIVDGDRVHMFGTLTETKEYSTVLGGNKKIWVMQVGTKQPEIQTPEYLRTWTLTEGNLQKDAAFYLWDSTTQSVVLLESDGMTTDRVSLKDLSAADQKHVKGLIADWRAAYRYPPFKAAVRNMTGPAK